VVREMVSTSSLYEACQELYFRYPPAVGPVDHGGRTVHSMLLMLQDDHDARFYVLSRDGSKRALYWFQQWPAGNSVDIDDDCDAAISDEIVNAVTSGVPIPRNGSLFGWTHRGAVTALLSVHAEYTPASPVPSWAVMPLVGVPEGQWPPFTGKRLLGSWFWDGYRTGKIVLLSELIAKSPGAVYWLNTKAILGSACCAVTSDLRSPDGYTLLSGRYVYYKALRDGKLVPSLTALLSDPGKVDLSPLFQFP
jgi:hypothetical protein